MVKGKRVNGIVKAKVERVAGAGEIECLTNRNFEEIKNLVAYVTGSLLPRISELEDTVRVLTEQVDRRDETAPGKRPRFFLGVESNDTDDDSDSAY